jgi:hypothetical protein
MKLSSKVIGTVSQKFECALMARSSFSSLDPIDVFVSLLNLTTFKNNL